MKLSQLLAGIKVKNTYSDIFVTDVAEDSRKILPGSLFVCKNANTTEGLAHVEQAVKAGACAIVSEYEIPFPNVILVEDAGAAYSKLCIKLFGSFSRQLQLIGVTGTNGKTTTTYLIKGILERAGYKTGLVGTVENQIGDQVIPAKYTTPEPHELQNLFLRMVEAGCHYCVMEVSSQALEQGRVEGCHFAAAVFTNLSHDHLDYHGTMESYLAAKQILFRKCDVAIVNYDDPYARQFPGNAACRRVTFSASADKADYVAKNIRMKPDGIAYELVGNETIGRVTTHIPGIFSVYNSMAASVCAIELGVPFAAVVKALADIPGIKGRMEIVPTGRDYTVVIDYAHSPDALRKALYALKEVASGRLVVLFGCGGDRDKSKRPLMGEAAAEIADFLVVTSDNPRTEAPQKIIEDILTGVKKHDTEYTVIENRREAIQFALENAQKNDIILLAGKGHELYQIQKERTVHFDEREIVAEILQTDRAV